MKLLSGMILMIGGLFGTVMSFLSSIVVSSSLPIFDGLELSLGLALFSIFAFINGIYTIFLSN